MPQIINNPTIVQAAGNRPKKIEEYVGRVNTKTSELSIARMISPSGWIEPGQSPLFDEYSVVLKGVLRATTKSGQFDIKEGQAILIKAGEWVQYSTPSLGGAEYIAVCLPAFSPESVHRDK